MAISPVLALFTVGLVLRSADAQRDADLGNLLVAGCILSVVTKIPPASPDA